MTLEISNHRGLYDGHSPAWGTLGQLSHRLGHLRATCHALGQTTRQQGSRPAWALGSTNPNTGFRVGVLFTQNTGCAFGTARFEPVVPAGVRTYPHVCSALQAIAHPPLPSLFSCPHPPPQSFTVEGGPVPHVVLVVDLTAARCAAKQVVE